MWIQIKEKVFTSLFFTSLFFMSLFFTSLFFTSLSFACVGNMKSYIKYENILKDRINVMEYKSEYVNTPKPFSYSYIVLIDILVDLLVTYLRKYVSLASHLNTEVHQQQSMLSICLMRFDIE